MQVLSTTVSPVPSYATRPIPPPLVLHDSLPPSFPPETLTLTCRKIRCCGGEPCKNCEKSSKPCEYEPVPDEVNKATRQKKAMSRAARVPSQTPSHQHIAPPPPYYGAPAPMYDNSYLAVPTVTRLGHRRTSSAPDFFTLTNQHQAQQQHTVSSPLMYDNGHQFNAPHTTQGWMSNDMNNAQYDQSVMPQVPDYQTYHAGPQVYSSYSSWSSNDTHHSSNSGMHSSGSQHSTHTGMTPSMSVPDLTQYMNVPVHSVHPGHNPHTPRHPHQSLSIDSSSTLSSVPTMSSPNTPGYYSGDQYTGPSADLSSFPTTFGSMGINNHLSTSPTLAPEYKHSKDLVGLGISQHSNQVTPTQRNPLQPSIMEPSLSDQFYVAY